ncbi:uncharacterized protein LOC113272858 [Papaver somniferum]|uniref:uncharacterized protein LOC113272858 n=1 Tax=Papaver somniferum TaxID=3469 RepID=UPI000E6FC2B1|nr:uncharacterized protein LOC113272858 [Papaver somniferum]
MMQPSGTTQNATNGKLNNPPPNLEGERIGIVTDPILQARRPEATQERDKKLEAGSTSLTQPTLKEMQKELEEHIRRERELRRLLREASNDQCAKECLESAEDKEEDHGMMTQEVMAKFFETNYKVVKQNNYDFMASPYTPEIVEYQYSEDYTSPKFKVSDGQGNAREHLSRFVASMNDRASDGKLCLREFPKSLTDMAFSWKVTTIDLSKCNQRLGEDIGKYITQFRHFALDCHENVKEDALVEICVRGMIPFFKKSLVNFRFPTLVELDEAAARIADYIEESNSDYVWHNAVNTVSITPRNNRANNNQEGWGAQTNQSYRDQPLPLPFPCDKEQIVGLQEQWMEDKEIQLPLTKANPTDTQKSNARYCHFHRRVQHPTVDCYNLIRMFQKKLEGGEFEMGDPDGAKEIQNHVMILSHDPNGDEWKPWEEKDEEACEVTIEGRVFTNTYGVARKFAGTVLAQQFFDSLGFSEDQSREAAKFIAAIAAGRPYDSLPREAIVFTDEDILYPGENLRPFYLTAYINKVPLKRSFVDGGASLNIISTHILEFLGVQRSAIKMRTTTVKVFGGHTQATIGIVHLVMKIGPIRGLTPFYVLEDDTTFHVLLGRGWLLNHKMVALTYHQCVKTNI